MADAANRALQAFAARIKDELVVAQVLIRRGEPGYELRHAADRACDPSTLRALSLNQVRSISQFTVHGDFRPLKSAPTLQAGWLLRVANDQELETALNQIYPGAIADCYAAESAHPLPLTDYREFTNRQSGMYRITTLLSDAQAARMIKAACHLNCCLKQRLWTVDGLAPDSPAEKSLIPCLEPCALLLEFARKTMRMEQQEKMIVEFAPEELATVRTALQARLRGVEAGRREGDFNSPENPRRIALLLEKLPALRDLVSASETE